MTLNQALAQTEVLDQDAPKPSTESYSYTQKESVLYIPVRLHLDSLTKLIKGHIPSKLEGTFAKESSWIKDGKYEVKIPFVKHKVVNKQYQLDASFSSGQASAFLGWKTKYGTFGETSKVEHIRGTMSVQPRLSLNGFDILSNPIIATKLRQVDLVSCVDIYIGEICSPDIPVYLHSSESAGL